MNSVAGFGMRNSSAERRPVTILSMFRKVLIANRGEIAVRVIRTLREMDVASVAVYSDADRTSLHVRMADEAAHVGPSPSAESYLRIDRILDAARRHGAEAIHPGYGFLSENEEIEAAFRDASSEAARAFGNPEIYIEKLIEKPRHIEIQLLGDRFGHMIHLGERECSLQRRHQKVIEECPSPLVALDSEMRRRM